MSGGAAPFPSRAERRELAARQGRVARILTFSAVDGPGNRAAVFLQGCSFDCVYCHNPETRPAVTAKARPGGQPAWPRAMTALDVVAAVWPYRAFLSGVTVSGGECGEQPDFLSALVGLFGGLGLPALVDTNGSLDYAARPDIVGRAAGFMLDLKAWDPVEHRRLTGADKAHVIANLRFLAAAGKLVELRTVVSPGLFDADSTVRHGARELAASGSAARYALIRFRPQGTRKAARDLPRPDDATMERLAAIAREEGAKDVRII